MAEPHGAVEPIPGGLPPRVVTRRFHGPVAGRYWVAAVLVPLLLSALVGLTVGPAMESQLERRALKALNKAGLGHVHTSFDGRQATLYLTAGRNQRRAAAVVAKVPGVGDVDVVAVPASAEEQRACADLQAKVDRATSGRRIPFAGESARLTEQGLRMARSVAALVKACPVAKVTAGGHTDSATFGGSVLTLRRAEVLRAVLVSAGVRPGNVVARGYAAAFPVATDDAPEARVLNQRGSVVVTRS